MSQVETVTIEKRLFERGKEKEQQGQWQEALDDYRCYLDSLPADAREQRSETERAIGRSYFGIGDIEAAYTSFERAYFEAEEAGLEGLMAHALGNMATIEYHKGNFQIAEKLMLRSINSAIEGSDTRLLTNGYLNIAHVYWKVSELDKAEKYYHSAKVLAIQRKADEDLLKAHFELGTLFFEQQKWEEALKNFYEQLRIAERTGNTTMYLKACLWLASTNRKKGSLKKAVEFLNYAQKSLKQSDNVPLKAKLYGELGKFLHAIEKFDEAVRAYQQQVKYARLCNNTALEGEAINNMGTSYLENKQYKEAREAYSQRLLLPQQEGDTKSRLNTFVNLAVLCKRTGDLLIAEEYLHKVKELLQQTNASHSYEQYRQLYEEG